MQCIAVSPNQEWSFIMLRTYVVLAMVALLIACNVEPQPDTGAQSPVPDTEQPVINTTTSIPPPVMFMAGIWEGSCESFMPHRTQAGGYPDLYIKKYLYIGLDAMLEREILPSDFNFNMRQEFIIYLDNQCTQIYEYWNSDPDPIALMLPEPVSIQVLPSETDPDLEDVMYWYFGFDTYIVGNAVETSNGGYAMEVDFLTRGPLLYQPLREIASRFVRMDIFAITDGGNTLLLGDHRETLYYGCLVANQDQIAAAPYEDYIPLAMNSYEGLTLTNIYNYNSSAYNFDSVQTYSTLQNTDSTYEYGYDPYAVMNQLIGASFFIRAVPFNNPCARPTELNYQKRFTRRYWPAWW
jgi:hypothetical protein